MGQQPSLRGTADASVIDTRGEHTTDRSIASSMLVEAQLINKPQGTEQRRSLETTQGHGRTESQAKGAVTRAL